MGVLYLILFAFIFVFFICSLVSVIQFVVDVVRTAKLKKELSDLVKKYSLFGVADDVSVADEKEGVENE